MRFVALDLETGGLTTDRSPLTAYFIVFDENFKIYGELDLKIKPNGGGAYIVDAGALAVNKINLIEHDRIAIPLDEAKKQLYKFLSDMSEEGRFKLTPVGQNVYFDIDFLYEHFISPGNWKNFCSYHVLDTASIATFFKVCQLMPLTQKTRLGELANFFDVTIGELHTAKEDTVVCVKILRKMIKKIKEPNNG